MSEYNEVLAIIIGDGCVTKRGYITLTHSIKQENWMMYKVNMLESFGFKMRVRTDERLSYGAIRGFIKADSTTTTRSKKIREFFYPNGFKIIPEYLIDKLGFKEWAIIFQDDGRQNKISHYNTLINGERIRVEREPFVNRYEISTDSFDMKSIENLQASLLKLGVESNIVHQSKNKKPLIAIGRAKSKAIFYEGVKPYIIPSMQYKISAKPSLSYNQTVND